LAKDKAVAMAILNQNFEVKTAYFKSIHEDNELKLDVILNAKTANMLLNTLIELGQVTRFVEKIPSVNDIFIQTVSS
jgi:ABC-2 type transport system ATP-binding protein